MKRRTVLGALVAASALVALGGGARAATSRGPTLQLIVIHAVQNSAGPASIDKQLRDLSQHLREKPFSAYNMFKQLDDRTLPLDKPASYPLANGRTLTVTLTTVDDAGSRDGGAHEKRYQLDTQISEALDAGKSPFLKAHVIASANEPFWLIGQSFQGGTLLLELVVRP